MANETVGASPTLLRTLRARLSAAPGPVSLTTLGRELLKAPQASPELVRRILLPFLEQIPEAILGDDNCIRWQAYLAHPTPDWPQLLLESRFAVIDVETTGRSSRHGRITEVACVLIERGEMTDTFTSLVNPGEPIPPLITALTGISDAMVADAPPFAAIAPQLRARLVQTVVVAHNASFDRRFLTAELTRADETFVWEAPTLCTVQLARRLVPGLDSYRLDCVTDHFRISNPARHRASGDALATAQLFLRLLNRLVAEGITTVEAATALMAKRQRSNQRRLRLPNEDESL
ncbi:MAG: exonuclease domain-containing protein [Chloracidobacterium sp.]|uniref:Exonuclease domain-containing protein n=1 Tax=Chloracidobacterium validum TaxID=2821543 RepID=A0ABX8B6H6_9BACT|nr:exonuclease domain-containing protein [Chloracidobacterium validum]QUW02576.1 hypothetical protein J8C06_09520 [Chloracidobacterium validum]